MATPWSSPTSAKRPESGGGGRGRGGGGGVGGRGTASSSSREGSAKAVVADQISQAVLSTSNLLHLMLQSSPSQAQLIKLPKNLLAKSSTIKNTELVLEQMPRVISSLDAHMDHGLQSVPHLETVIQLLSNIESCQVKQLKSLSKAQLSQEEHEDRPPEQGEKLP